MFMIAEIVLTVIAWKRGWRGWALLPLPIILGVAFIATIIFFAVRGPQELPLIAEILIDVVYILTLIVMAACPRRKVRSPVLPGQAAPGPESFAPAAIQTDTGPDPGTQKTDGSK